MSGSVRIHFAAGVTAVAVAATAMSPTTPPALQGTRLGASSAPVELTAAVKPLVVAPMTIQQLTTARNAIAALDPAAAQRLPDPAALAAAPTNGVSSFIDSAYQFIRYWVSYGVQLADYVLGFIPFGGLIGDQINILYNSLVLPIADSTVYQLIIPVVNEPLNPASYVNGLIAVGQTSVNALIQTGINELRYFFGGLIPPLPPLPFAAVESTTLKIADVEAPTAAKGPLAGLAALATDVDEHVQAFVPKPRDTLRALESALHPARTEVTTDTDDADARPDGAINKFVKRLTANSPRATEKSEKSDAQSTAKKPLRQLKDAIRAATKPKTDASGAKDRSPRAPRHAKADAKN